MARQMEAEVERSSPQRNRRLSSLWGEKVRTESSLLRTFSPLSARAVDTPVVCALSWGWINPLHHDDATQDTGSQAVSPSSILIDESMT
jgi:hypothetical protein